MSEWVKIHAPATTSNLGAGFDIFGLALDEPYDIIEGRKIDSGIVIKDISGPGSDEISRDPYKNSVSIAAKEVLKRTGVDFGIEVKIKKGIRPCSGIGSSGASAAGGAYLAHVLSGEKLSLNEVVLCATCAENAIAGGFHADNVAPCIFGGFTIIRSYEPFEVISIKPPENLGIVIAMPDILVPIKESRQVLPSEVSVKDLVFHVGNASCMVHGMEIGNVDLIGRSVKDAVFEPAREKLIPHLKEAENKALSVGAKASFLGGSGPCIISFYNRSDMNGQIIADAVRKVYNDNGIKCDTWVTVCGDGCKKE